MLCCAGVVGVGEEEREECKVEVMSFLRGGEVYNMKVL